MSETDIFASSTSNFNITTLLHVKMLIVRSIRHFDNEIVCFVATLVSLAIAARAPLPLASARKHPRFFLRRCWHALRLLMQRPLSKSHHVQFRNVSACSVQVEFRYGLLRRQCSWRLQPEVHCRWTVDFELCTCRSFLLRTVLTS